MPVERRGLDGGVDALLGREPGGHERVAPLIRPAVLRERLGGQVVRQHVEPVRRHAQQRGLACGVAARHHEAVDRLEDGRLVAGERHGVDGGLGQRAAAVEGEPGQRVAMVAAKAGAAVACRHADGAEEPQVVEVHEHGCSGRARRLEAARPGQRQHVVHVHHVGVQLARRGLHVVLVAASAEERESRLRA